MTARVAVWKRQAPVASSSSSTSSCTVAASSSSAPPPQLPIVHDDVLSRVPQDEPEDVVLTVVSRPQHYHHQQQRPSVSIAGAHRSLVRTQSPPASSTSVKGRRASVMHAPLSRTASSSASSPYSTPRAPPPRPRTSMSPHATHAMALHLQEYQQRVELACASTYDRALRVPPPSSSSSPPSSFCRARVLASNRELFRVSESPPPPFSAPVDLKRSVQRRSLDAHVLPFHHMTPRRHEFLYGSASSSSRDAAALASDAAGSAMAKDHYALGPGQYDVGQDPRLRPRAAAVKFSPSDRFHESYSTDRPGPGQYLTSETQTTARPVAAVFSQRPRETELGTVTSPTANVVSSYYYAPPSAFDPTSMATSASSSSSGRHGCWPRTPRFKRKERERLVVATPPRSKKNTAPPIDFDARNRRELQRASALVRQRRRLMRQAARGVEQAVELEEEIMDEHAPPPTVRRRSSFVAAYLEATAAAATAVTAPRSETPVSSCSTSAASTKPAATTPSSAPAPRVQASGAVSLRRVLPERERFNLLLRSWITIAWLAAFQQRMTRFHAFARRVRHVAATQRQRRLQLTFDAWKLLDEHRHRAYAAQLVSKNAFRWRLMVRIRRRARHAAMLRQFLGGLSIDVRFALAMKRIKRKIMLLQRWWRHVQLMVRAREEALFHKWIAVENRLRLEYIGQMPHLQRIFQAPATSAGNGSSNSSSSNAVNGASSSHMHAHELQLHKLLNLPDQKRWFGARFVLHSDGSLRGYAADGSNELLVEVKHFRCHFHDVADTTLAMGDADDRFMSASSSAALFGASASPLGDNGALLHAYSSYTNAAWKPFLMVFRPGAFRFVLLASTSHLPTEIMSWKDKLERLMTSTMSASSTGSASGASFSGGSFLHTQQSSSLALLTSVNGYNHRGSLTSTDENDVSSQTPSPSSSRSPSFRSSVGELVEVTMQSGLLAPSSSLPTADNNSNSTSSGHGASTTLSRSPSAARGKFQARVRSVRQRHKSGLVVTEGPLSYYVVDLLRDFPKVPSTVIWHTIREKLREKRKAFRAEIYRYKLELHHFHQHQSQIQNMHVLDKFRDFFTLERPRRPHFRSLISNRKMEALIRQTIEQVKVTAPPNPRYLLDANRQGGG